MPKSTRKKVQRVAARPRKALPIIPDRRLIVSIDGHTLKSMMNGLPGIFGSFPARSTAQSPPESLEQSGSIPAFGAPLRASAEDEHIGSFPARTEPQATQPEAEEPTAYVSLAERDPALSKAIKAAVERLATKQPVEAEAATPQDEPGAIGTAAAPESAAAPTPAEPAMQPATTSPAPSAAELAGIGMPAAPIGAAPPTPQPDGVPLDTQFRQAEELAVKSLLWISRGVLLGIGFLGTVTLAVWALFEAAKHSGGWIYLI